MRAEQARNDRTIVLRRMNREEYNNTIRDLIGIDFEFVNEFPEDPPAGGFDNNGGALTISPLHLELYLKAAQKILDRAIVTEKQRPPRIKWHFELEEGNKGPDRYRVRIDNDRNRSVIVNGGDKQRGGAALIRHPWSRWVGVRNFSVPRPGDYLIRIRAAGVTPPEEAARRVGPQLQVRNQEDRERKISNAAERRKSRERFDKYIIPRVRKHFADDRRYRFGPPRMKVTGYLGGSRRILAEMDVDAPVSGPKTYEIHVRFTPLSLPTNRGQKLRKPRKNSQQRSQHWQCCSRL